MTALAVLLKTGQVSQVDGGERGNPPLLLLLSDLLTVSPAGLIRVREARGAAWIHLPRQAAQETRLREQKHTQSMASTCIGSLLFSVMYILR